MYNRFVQCYSVEWRRVFACFMMHHRPSACLLACWCCAVLLQAFVAQLDKRYVRVVGFMMHLNGYPDEQKAPLSQQFLQVRDIFCFTRFLGHMCLI
jgi:hypothetical protein